MLEPLSPDLRFGPGFSLTDRLDSPFRLAVGHDRSCSSAVDLLDVNGGFVARLLEAGTVADCRVVCFAPDGRTLFVGTAILTAKDLPSGEVRELWRSDTPEARCLSLDCSPDGRTLVLMSGENRRAGKGRIVPGPRTVSAISADNGTVRALYTDPQGARTVAVECDWRRHFALGVRVSIDRDDGCHELARIDLDSGVAEVVGRSRDTIWDLALHPAGQSAAWGGPTGRIWRQDLDAGELAEDLAAGRCPAWSPSGDSVAFMADQDRLRLLDIASGRTTDLIWFERTAATPGRRPFSFSTTPRWSPDGRQLWFSLTQSVKMPAPRSIPEAAEEAWRFVQPALHNLNPGRTSRHAPYRRVANRPVWGVADLAAKQIALSPGCHHGVAWLPVC
ncbi:MAG TPA: hypothetical protein VKT77_03950 [Chthonomonadaceae bacterium]|nr:hypothetical protein [Chthonomonadaceae bacterium]